MASSSITIRKPLLPEAARPLILFVYLQALDVLTTMAFLLGGVREANPLVNWAMGIFGDATVALVAIKLAALLLGFVCWITGRERLLRRANVYFALLVGWNLWCLILALSSRIKH
jgi:hypothetical protein